MRAIQSLEKQGDAEAIALLLAVHDDEAEKPVIRNLAMDALAGIGTAAVADELEKRIPTYTSRRGQKVVARKVQKIRQSL